MPVGHGQFREKDNTKKTSAPVEGSKISAGGAGHCRDNFHDGDVMDGEGVPMNEGVQWNMEAAFDLGEKGLETSVPRPFDIRDFDLGVLPQGVGEAGGKMPPREADEK
jgi:hypothetical protein